MAAEQGYTPAESSVGRLILKQRRDDEAAQGAAGEAENAAAIVEARRWLQRAAAKGHEQAISALNCLSSV